MPEEGIDWLAREALLTWEEQLRLCRILAAEGVNKVRITGGEPLVRKGIMPFLHQLAATTGITDLALTTNGVVTAPLVPELKKLGIKAVNLSLDTLDRNRFQSITCRDELDKVLATLDALLQNDIAVKINAVVMAGRNTGDLLPLAELSRDMPVAVRFIEEMPFNGGSHTASIEWDYVRIMETIRQAHPTLEKLTDGAHSTSFNYAVPGFKGTIGVIPAFSRTFCGTCNRIRITPQGIMKTCLYEGGGLDLRTLLRNNATDQQIITAIQAAISTKYLDGRQAEQISHAMGIHESMATIGG
jgi:cyclic pyranopterin phosphate synthase